MARPPKPPAPLTIGSYTARPVGKGADKQGRWLWRLEWYPEGGKGKQRTRGMGRVSSLDVEREAHKAIAGGLDAPALAPGPVLTWGLLLRAALAAWRKDGTAGILAPRSVVAYDHAVSRLLYLAETWPTPSGARALDEQARRIRDDLLRAGVAPSTTRQTLATAAKAWGWGVREERVAPLPWPRVTVKVEPPERHIPTADELARVIAAMRARDLRPHEGRHGWPWVALVLAWSTGPRIGEMAQLRVGDVDLGDDPEVIYGRHDGARKTGRRAVPLDEATAEAVRAMLGRRVAAGEILTPESRLWPVEPTAIENDGWMRHHVRPSCEAAGVLLFRPHDVRAAVVEDLYRRGADPREAADLLGHSVATALGYYRRTRLDRKRALAGLRDAGAVLGGEVGAKVVSIEDGRRK